MGTDTRITKADVSKALVLDASGRVVAAGGTYTAGNVLTAQASGPPIMAAPTGGSGGGGGGAADVIGQASFSASGGAISGLVIAGIVASVTRVSAGRYAVTFASAQPDVNYHPSIVTNDDATAAMFSYIDNATLTVNGFQFYTYAFGPNTPQDRGVVRLSIFRYAGSGTSVGTPPTYRASSGIINNGGSITLALPTGSVAGDTTILIVGSGNAPFAPTGWSAVRFFNATAGHSAAVFTKVLDAADITAGSVTVTLSGGYWNSATMVTYQGSILGIDYIDDMQDPSAFIARYQNKSFTIPTVLTAGHDVLLAMLARGDVTSTSSVGTLLQNVHSGDASQALYRYTPTSTGAVTTTINIPGSSYEQHFIRIAIRGA